MDLKIIKTKKQYEETLSWIDEMFDKKIKPNTLEGEKLQIALLIVKHYEDINYSIPFPNAIDAIKIKMEDLGIKNKDMVQKIGSKGYVSSILNKRKPMTLEIAKIFHRELHIPAEVLLQ